MQHINFHDDILSLKDKLFQLVLHIIPDRAEAEDIVQETLIRVWERRDEWPQMESIESFCTVIARHLAIDRSKQMEHQQVGLSPEMDRFTSAPGPYEHLVSKERLMLLHRLVNALPDKQRQIMQLREIEGKSYKEIASLLCLTEEQVKVNLFRARQKIKQQFINIDEYGL